MGLSGVETDKARSIHLMKKKETCWTALHHPLKPSPQTRQQRKKIKSGSHQKRDTLSKKHKCSASPERTRSRSEVLRWSTCPTKVSDDYGCVGITVSVPVCISMMVSTCVYVCVHRCGRVYLCTWVYVHVCVCVCVHVHKLCVYAVLCLVKS